MRLIFFCPAVLLFLGLSSCRKACDTVTHKPVLSAAAAAWKADSSGSAFRMALDSTERIFYNTGTRTDWYYPEREEPCHDLYLTVYDRYVYDADSLKLEYRIEKNDLSGERVRVWLAGAELSAPLGSSSGSITVPQPDGSKPLVTHQQLDSLVIDSVVYRPVNVLELLSSSPDPLRVYITPHWGVVRFELTNGSYWNRQR